MVTAKEIRSYVFDQIKPTAMRYSYKTYTEPQAGGIIKKESHLWTSSGFYILNRFNYNEVGGFSAFIYFPEVTSIVNPILVRNKLNGGKETDHFTFFKARFPRVQVDCHTMEDLHPFAEQYVKCFTEMALPYFEEWGKLTKLYDIIKDMNEDELFEKRGIHYEYTTPVILRLCNDPRYKEFIDSVCERYAKVREKYLLLGEDDSGYEPVMRNYNASKELREALEHIKPLYNI